LRSAGARDDVHHKRAPVPCQDRPAPGASLGLTCLYARGTFPNAGAGGAHLTAVLSIRDHFHVAIDDFLLIAAGSGLLIALPLATSWRRYLAIVAAGVIAAVAFTVLGVKHSHDPGCRECGDGFFAALFAGYALAAWALGAAVGTLIRRISRRISVDGR
jgi:hypothetical protein